MAKNNHVTKHLNSLLTAEFTAINQNLGFGELCQNRLKLKLNKILDKQKMDEMNHASWLMQRIIFLGGKPNISRSNPTKINQSVSDILLYMKEKEINHIHAYQHAIISAKKAGDWVTANLLNKILKVKRNHIDRIERQQNKTEMAETADFVSNENDTPSSWL